MQQALEYTGERLKKITTALTNKIVDSLVGFLSARFQIAIDWKSLPNEELLELKAHFHDLRTLIPSYDLSDGISSIAETMHRLDTLESLISESNAELARRNLSGSMPESKKRFAAGQINANARTRDITTDRVAGVVGNRMIALSRQRRQSQQSLPSNPEKKRKSKNNGLKQT